MKRILLSVFSILIVLSFVFASGNGTRVLSPGQAQPVPGQKMKPLSGQTLPKNAMTPDLDFGKMPLYFIANKGQVNSKAKFYAKAARYTLWMTQEGLVFDSFKKNKPTNKNLGPLENQTNKTGKADHSFKRDVSGMYFLGAQKSAQMLALDKAKLGVNFFLGNDKSKWLGNVPTSMAVEYKNLYQNIDLKVYGIEKEIEYDWIVRAGGDVRAIRFQYKNVRGTRLDKEGNLLIKTDFGELKHKRPVSYQQDGNKKIPVLAQFKKRAKNTYGFEVGEYDKSRPLIIDPIVLAYSTYLGGEGSETGRDIAVDSSGNVYVTGTTGSINFPTLNQYQTDQEGTDVFVTILDPTQSGAASLLYSTYLGGGGNDSGAGIAVDGSGMVYVAGETYSTNFPTLNQYQTDQASEDVFVTKLDPTQSGASSLLYSTYLGGESYDQGEGIALDSSGNVYVTGTTRSTNFPTLNQYQTDQVSWDVFVTKLDPTQSGASSLLYSTYLGGGSDEMVFCIAVDGSDMVYVTGHTWSTNFPTLNQYQTNLGGRDVFVTKLDPTQRGASSLIYSTYLGGGGDDTGQGIALDGSGNVYVTGGTESTNFPTLNQYQTDQGLEDVFVTKLDTTQRGASSLLYSTYLGGGDGDFVTGIAVDGSGNVYVTGYTVSSDFPTLNQYQTDQGGADVFVTKLDPTQRGASSLLYSTYLGGGSLEIAYFIAVDGSGMVYVAGYTASSDFPTLNQYQTDQGGADVFVTKLIYSVVTPTVATPSISAVGYSTATLGGEVTATGDSNITERGIWWSTTNGFTPPGQGTKVSDTGNCGTGAFTVDVTGLPIGTPIYFQAFATNGAGSGYSVQDFFSTLSPVTPTVTTAPLTTVAVIRAAGGGEVLFEGGAPVTARGLCWSMSPTPTIGDHVSTEGTGPGSFKSNAIGLNANTTYYLRAYATNSVGSSYGEQRKFKTKPTPNPSPLLGPDFNGDGQVDIVWHDNDTGGTNVVWLLGTQTGTASVTDASLAPEAVGLNPSLNLAWKVGGTADFNNDGKPDIVFHNSATGGNVVWFMNGLIFTLAKMLPTNSTLDWQLVDTGDFNYDGKPDLLFHNSADGRNEVWYQNGVTRTGVAALDTSTNLDWILSASGDFNLDGKEDLLFHNKTDGRNVVWYLNGVSRTGIAFLPTNTDLNWSITAASDFNGDGKIDILFRNTSDGRNSIWYMDGIIFKGNEFLSRVTDQNWIIGN